jgi:hypothetical protein
MIRRACLTLATTPPDKTLMRFTAPGFPVAALLLMIWLYPRVFGADVYTLYRNSGTDMTEAGYSPSRIHVGTFDPNETGTYNQEHCDVARTLFKGQFGITAVNYWCEKGRYKR